MVNKVILVGNLGKDPESMKTKSEKTVCKFSLATTDGFGDNKKTSWHNITCWNKTADFCSQYLKKGDRVYIDGRIDYQEWEKDGVKHYRTEIVAFSVQSLGVKSDRPAQNNVESQVQPENGLPF